MCFSLGEVPKEAERPGAAVSLELPPTRVCSKLLNAKSLATSVGCMEGWMCADGLRVFDGDVHTVFVK